MQISAIFWNVWFDIQDGTHDDGAALLRRLDALITEYQPDIIGLNEVLALRGTYDSRVVDALKSHGYAVHFSSVYEHSDHAVTGNVFATKLPVTSVTHHHMERAIGREPKHKFYTQSQLIEARLHIAEQPVTVFVTHLASIWPRQWPTHIRQRKAFDTLIQTPEHDNVIIGGDFNELKMMVPWVQVRRYKTLTGSIARPTWRWRATKRSLIHGNLDRILYGKKGNLRLKSFRVLPRKPSDHAPLLAVFTLEDKPR